MNDVVATPKDEPMIYVVDDDDGGRSALLFLIRSLGFRARGYASAGGLLEAIPQLPPGCILTDLRMPEITGLQLMTLLQERHRVDPIIVMTAYADVPSTVSAFRSGAIQLLEKPFSDEVLQRTLAEGLETLARRRAADSQQSAAAEKLARLTPREVEVAREVSHGRSTKVIARMLGLSPRTVDAYRANIYEKTGCSSVAEIVALMMLVMNVPV